MTNPTPSWQTDQPPAYPPGTNQAPQNQAPGSRMVNIQGPQTRPLVTYAIMAVTILVFLLQQASNIEPFHSFLLQINRLVFGEPTLQALLNNGWGSDLLVLLGGMNNVFIHSGQIWRFVTPALLHFGLTHIGANMYSLFVLGPSLERFYGHSRFFGLYLLGAIGGNLLSFYMSAPQGVSAGASTAIFGLIAAQGVFIFQNRALFGARARAMLNNVIFLIVLNLVIGYTFQFDNWGHLGGLLAGAAFAWFAGPHLEVEQEISGYRLVDRRSPGMVVLIWTVIFILLAGLAFLGIYRA